MILAHKAWPINLHSFRVGHAVKACTVGLPQHRLVGDGRGARRLSCFSEQKTLRNLIFDVARDPAWRTSRPT